MDMIEKMARAICKDLWGKGLIDMELPPEDFLIPAKLTAFVAIEAMREPTLEMEAEMKKRVYELFMDWQEDEEQLRSVYPKLWTAMIDAAVQQDGAKP